MPAGDASESGYLLRLRKDPSDEAAWRELYKRYWPHVLMAARRTLRPGVGAMSDAEDVAQEVFVKLAAAVHSRQLELPTADASIRGLLTLMTKNRSIDLARRARGKVRDVRRQEPIDDGIPGPADPPDSAMEASETFEKLLRRLDRVQQRILWATLEGVPQTAIAQAVKIDVRTVQRHLSFIRQALSALEIS